MNEGGFSEATMLASLHDIRLPTDAPGGPTTDLAASLGLACLAAICVVAFLRLVTIRKPRPRSEPLAERLRRLEDMPEPDRRVALLHLLRQHAPDRYAMLQSRLYKADALDTSALEAEVARLV